MNWIDKEYHDQPRVVEPWMKPGKGHIPDVKCNCDAYCWVGALALLCVLVTAVCQANI